MNTFIGKWGPEVWASGLNQGELASGRAERQGLYFLAQTLHGRPAQTWWLLNDHVAEDIQGLQTKWRRQVRADLFGARTINPRHPSKPLTFLLFPGKCIRMLYVSPSSFLKAQWKFASSLCPSLWQNIHNGLDKISPSLMSSHFSPYYPPLMLIQYLLRLK